MPDLIELAYGVLFVPGGKQRWNAHFTRRIAGVPLLVDCCLFLGDIKVSVASSYPAWDGRLRPVFVAFLIS